MDGEDTISRRLSELRATQAVDATLRNLISILQTKLETSARLPVLVFEAEGDGDFEGAALFRYLVASERQQIAALLNGLKTRIDAQLDTAPAASPAGATSPSA
jgi:hypothetical protein